VLIEDIDLPKLTEGEFVAIPVSGAYHLSMASNYNGARRPAVILLHDGKTTLIQRRETIKDLIDRDQSL
jgi:diaminopimelate decarboxylase